MTPKIGKFIVAEIISGTVYVIGNGVYEKHADAHRHAEDLRALDREYQRKNPAHQRRTMLVLHVGVEVEAVVSYKLIA